MSPIFQSSLHSLFTPWAEVERHRFYINLENFWPNSSQKCHSGIIFATEGPDKHDHFQPGESYSITLRQIPSNFKVFPSLISTSCLNTITGSSLEIQMEGCKTSNLYKSVGYHPHMTSLFWRGVGVPKIVTLSDVRGEGVLKKVTSPKNISISNIIK